MSELEFQIFMIEIELEFFAYVDSLPKDEIKLSDYLSIQIKNPNTFIQLPPQS